MLREGGRKGHDIVCALKRVQLTNKIRVRQVQARVATPRFAGGEDIVVRENEDVAAPPPAADRRCSRDHERAFRHSLRHISYRADAFPLLRRVANGFDKQ
jgi:hypothetical protein